MAVAAVVPIESTIEETVELVPTPGLPEAHAVVVSDGYPLAIAVPMVDKEQHPLGDASVSNNHHHPPQQHGQQQHIIDTDDGVILATTEINVEAQERGRRNLITVRSAIIAMVLLAVMFINGDVDDDEDDSNHRAAQEANGETAMDEQGVSAMEMIAASLVFYAVFFLCTRVLFSLLYCCLPCVWGDDNGILILKLDRLEACRRIGNGLYRSVRNIPLSKIRWIEYTPEGWCARNIVSVRIHGRKQDKVWCDVLEVTNGQEFVRFVERQRRGRQQQQRRRRNQIIV